MVVSDQHLNAAPVGFRHAIDAGDPVVNSDDDVRATLCRECDDFRRQSIAKLKAIGHDKFNFRAHRA